MIAAIALPRQQSQSHAEMGLEIPDCPVFAIFWTDICSAIVTVQVDWFHGTKPKAGIKQMDVAVKLLKHMIPKKMMWIHAKSAGHPSC